MAREYAQAAALSRPARLWPGARLVGHTFAAQRWTDEQAVSQASAEGRGRRGRRRGLLAVVAREGGSRNDEENRRGRRRHAPGISLADERSVPFLRSP